MVWQVWLSLAVTLPAVFIGFGTCIYFLCRRVRIARKYRRLSEGHVDSDHCRCGLCALFRGHE